MPYPLKNVKRQETLELRIQDGQYEFIKGKFGKEPAEKANYGWATIDVPNGVEIHTKVYGHGVVVTIVHFGDECMAHAFKPF